MIVVDEVMINGRWPLLLPKHRAVRPSWPWWEATRLAAMRTVIGPGSVVYDIGAEEGDFPALWGSWGAQVALAEPNPRVWPNIRLVWEQNDLPTPLGCWAGFVADHVTDLASDLDGWPLSAYGPVISDHGFCRVEERPDLPCTTVDILAGRLTPPTVITMDVEGAEHLVLAGAAATLAEHRPEVFVSVHPEFMLAHFGIADGLALVRQIMEDADYELTHLCVDHEVHDWYSPR